jgi:S1-C subfamily serine protease
LLNSLGQLVGVNTAIYSPSGGSAGIGFAIPVNTVKEVVPQLIAYGKLLRPILGVELASDQWTRRYGVEGVVVVRVQRGLPAAEAGLIGAQRGQRGEVRLGDVITHIENDPVRNHDDYLSTLEKYKVGDTITLTTQRGKRELKFEVTLSESR